MPDETPQVQPTTTDAPSISAGAQRIIDGAAERQQESKHAQLGANHWLLELIMRHGPMAEDMARGLESASLQKFLRDQLSSGNFGLPLDNETLIARATDWARARGKEQVT